MPEKEITKKITRLVKELDKVAQAVTRVLDELKDLKAKEGKDE